MINLNEYFDNFKSNVKDVLLHYHGISQSKLAIDFNISVSNINAKLSERNNPTIEFALMCSKYFNVPLDVLFFETLDVQTVSDKYPNLGNI